MDTEIGNGIGNLNAEELAKLNLRLKSQFAGEFIQMMTEVKKRKDEFLVLLSFLKAMESKCFTRCIRKPGIQAEKSDEVKIIFIPMCLRVYIFLGLFGKVYGQVYGILVCCRRNCRSHSI